jgi:hypothetical protein
VDSEKVTSFEQLDALLAEGKITEEEYNDLWNAMRPKRETSGTERTERTERSDALSVREIVWILASLFFLTVGVASIVYRVPILPAIAGAAVIVQYRITPRELLFAKSVTRAGAYFAGAMIVFAILAQA